MRIGSGRPSTEGVGVFAVTTRGLEAISAEEMAALPGVTVDGTGYRRVTAHAAAPLQQLLRLRTVDDLFLDLSTWQGIGPERGTLEILRTLSAQADLRTAASLCGQLRGLASPPTFSITANFVGRRNYTSEEIKAACAAGFERGHRGWTYTPDDREADLNVRVFIEHTTAYAGVRLAASPLQNRPYKQEHVPGSLRPPVAAAMVLLARVDAHDLVVDPCCGAGTLLVEAAHRGGIAVGGDDDALALDAARANASEAGLAVALHRWDARALPISGSTARGIITNPPWGRKVDVGTDIEAFYAEIGREVCRVLEPGGRAAVLSWAPEWVRAWGLRSVREIEISLYGRTPTVLVLEH